VQLPPRGVWGSSAQVTWATAEAWLGRPLKVTASLDGLVRRYLGAFGPATVADIRSWSGLAGLRDVVDRLRRRLLTFRTVDGDELFDLPNAPRPDRNSPAPPRFLPYYDNVLLGHADRSRVIPEGGDKWFFPADGLFVGTTLIDGFLGGRWKIERDGDAKASRHDRATLIVEHFVRLRKQDRTALTAEGRRLLSFSAPEARSHVLRLTDLS
jgi:Winged helix DNA-binding domain